MGKKESDYQQTTSRSLQNGDWSSNLILLGSPNSNTITEQALAGDSAPFAFKGPYSETIVNKKTNATWKSSKSYDYAMISRITRKGKTTLVLAGIGPIGTAAACYYLSAYYRAISQLISNTGSFGIILEVSRQKDFTQCRVVHSS